MATEGNSYVGYVSVVLGGILLLIVILTFISHNNRLTTLEQSTEPISIEVKLEQPEFLTKGPRDGLMEALLYYEIPEPEIVYSQAYLETGNFNPRFQRVKDNNLFGLYNSKRKRYMRFDHWVGSVEAYKEYFSNRYTDTNEDYYHFLTRIGYAKDLEYVSKVKEIRKQLFEND